MYNRFPIEQGEEIGVNINLIKQRKMRKKKKSPQWMKITRRCINKIRWKE